MKLEGRTVGAEADDVAILNRCVAGDALAVDERAVAAPQILEHERITFVDDGSVARGDIEVAFGVEAHVG